MLLLLLLLSLLKTTRRPDIAFTVDWALKTKYLRLFGGYMMQQDCVTNNTNEYHQSLQSWTKQQSVNEEINSVDYLSGIFSTGPGSKDIKASSWETTALLFSFQLVGSSYPLLPPLILLSPWSWHQNKCSLALTCINIAGAGFVEK